MTINGYRVSIAREGGYWLASFPDCPGCQTFAESLSDLLVASGEALEGWLEAHEICGLVPPTPWGHTAQGEPVHRLGAKT